MVPSAAILCGHKQPAPLLILGGVSIVSVADGVPGPVFRCSINLEGRVSSVGLLAAVYPEDEVKGAALLNAPPLESAAWKCISVCLGGGIYLDAQADRLEKSTGGDKCTQEKARACGKQGCDEWVGYFRPQKLRISQASTSSRV